MAPALCSSVMPRASRLLPLAVIVAVHASACAGHLASRPDVYETWRSSVEIGGRRLDVTFVKPIPPVTPKILVLFATGDAGWRGVSGEVFEHLAGKGYYLAGYDARQIVRQVKRSGSLTSIPAAAAAVDALIVHSRRALGVPDGTRTVVTGFSLCAKFLVFTAGVQSLQHHVSGAVAMALTRETDFIQAPPPGDRPPQLQVDERGRIQTYPAIALAGPIPFAVIQSAGDHYVTAEEARRLFGSDTSTRRLYEVAARNHGFSGGKDALLRDIDDALTWVEAR